MGAVDIPLEVAGIPLAGGILQLEVVEDIPLWGVDRSLPEGAAVETLLEIHLWVELVALGNLHSDR